VIKSAGISFDIYLACKSYKCFFLTLCVDGAVYHGQNH